VLTYGLMARSYFAPAVETGLYDLA
jgi:hypothetical protein